MTKRLPESVRRLIHTLAELPSIGPRQATRLVFYLVSQGGPALKELESAIAGLEKIGVCERCYFIHDNEGGLCDICANKNRDQSIIMILEKETDLISIENTSKYHGRYFIIGPIPKIGSLADWQRKRLEDLKSFIKKELSGEAREIILGFNPTSVGDFNASVIQKELFGSAKKITRLGRGLPTGGEIEFADEDTLSASLDKRG